MQTFSKILVSLFVINAILIQNLVGLSVSEMVLEDIKPSFDCEAKNLTTSEMEMCDGIGMIPPSYFAIIDNFYASYYNAVIKRIKSNDKTTIKQISLQMIKERGKVCPNTTFDEAYLHYQLNAIIMLTARLLEKSRNLSTIPPHISPYLRKSFIQIHKHTINLSQP